MLAVNQETIRTWAKEFGNYLSNRAKPAKGKHRAFTREDIETFSLVADLKDNGLRFEDIHANLESGQRGIFPATARDNPLVGMDAELALQKIKNLERQLELSNQQLQVLRTVQDENIRLSTRLEDAETERERLETQIAELTTAIQTLSIKAGEQYARGYVDGLTVDQQSDDTKPTDSQLQ
jgi:DNA-binding transcriptional MerR regulator